MRLPRRFAWWIERLKSQLELFDLVRIDHFRGLQAYWGVPADADSARALATAPGAALLSALRQRFEPLAVVAEDLGVITPEVDALREAFGLPGMRVLQFAFSGIQTTRTYRRTIEPTRSRTRARTTTTRRWAGIAAWSRRSHQR